MDGITDTRTWIWANFRDSEGQGDLASYSPWGHKESDMTGQLNNNNIKKSLSRTIISWGPSLLEKKKRISTTVSISGKIILKEWRRNQDTLRQKKLVESVISKPTLTWLLEKVLERESKWQKKSWNIKMKEGPKRVKIQGNTIDVSSGFEFFLTIFDDWSKNIWFGSQCGRNC